MKTAYLTGTFDTLHEAHLVFLKAARALCDCLIVGVTTDEVAVSQKRQPQQSFQQRLAVIEACRYVDIALPHTGQTKQDAFRHLGFDLLITGAEYINSAEFADYDCTPVVYLPRSPLTSSTKILQTTNHQALLGIQVITVGMSGILFRLGDHLVKELRMTADELFTTADVHQLGLPRPRNWKKIGATWTHPNIPGVNPNREAAGAAITAHFPWSTVREVTRKYRSSVLGITWIIQKYIPATLSSLWSILTPGEHKEVEKQVRVICDDLRGCGVVHGDIHADNLCIELSPLRVYLIDFGWCMSAAFQMCPAETEEYQTCLQTDFDWQHYTDSLAWRAHQESSP